MSNIFWKNLHLCFSSALSCPNNTTNLNPSSPPSNQNHDDDDHHHNQSSSSSSSDPTSLLIKNFNSLYDFSSEFSTSKDDDLLSSNASSTSSSSDTPDFAAVFASKRFFFSSPGRSNSIIESSEETVPLDDGVAVKKYSPDPYTDFRCSMLEMIEAKNLKDVIGDWDLLHELLFCYLTLNPKHTHKCIIGAFADILVSLLSQEKSEHHRR